MSMAVFLVAFATEVLDHFTRIERKTNGAVAGCDIGEGIVQGTGRPPARPSKRRAPVTDRLGAKAEISRPLAELSGELEPGGAFGTAIMVDDRVRCEFHFTERSNCRFVRLSRKGAGPKPALCGAGDST